MQELWSEVCRFLWDRRDAGTETVDTEKCGQSGGDPLKKDNFKDSVLRLMAQVTARNIKRD